MHLAAYGVIGGWVGWGRGGDREGEEGWGMRGVDKYSLVEK